MTDDANGMHAAVAAGVLAAENDFAELLRSVVEVARAIFGARASSILLFDEASDELVFAAVAGAGEQSLVGRRMPSDTGIAGWVLSSRTPLVLEDVSNDPRFARDVAEKTGYVPERDDGGAAARRRAGARRAAGARSPQARPVLVAGDGAARPVREPGCDRARPARLDPPGQGRARRRRRALGRRRAWRPRSRAWRASAAQAGLALLQQLERVLRAPELRAQDERKGPEGPSARRSACVSRQVLDDLTCALTSSSPSSSIAFRLDLDVCLDLVLAALVRRAPPRA